MRSVVRKKITSFPNLEKEVTLKDIPELNVDDYINRIKRIQWRMSSYTHLLVYGDREHFSNIEFFTGFDPRFEEALLVIPKDGIPSIIVGNEGDSYSDIVGYEFKKFVFPTFSLPGQPRNSVQPLDCILRLAGLDGTSTVGIIGWKLFLPEDHLDPDKTFDIPFFIMESLLKVVSYGNIRNAVGLMIDLKFGLRISLEIKELLLSEIAGTFSSRNTFRVLENLREGMTEIEASENLRINGMPLSVHPNINFGKNLYYGLGSPTAGTKLMRGDTVGVGMAYRRSLCHKVGYYIEGPSEEPEKRREFYNKYFSAILAWYRALQIGVSGGQIYEAISNEIGDLSEFGIKLNPGHLIHTDEWTNSPFKLGCKEILCSGMMIQCDFTAARPDQNLIAHAEDGVILADENTRKLIKEISPSAWGRMQTRRRFMIEELGIQIAEDVLPTSDLPGVIIPYMCNPRIILAYA